MSALPSKSRSVNLDYGMRFRFLFLVLVGVGCTESQADSGLGDAGGASDSGADAGGASDSGTDARALVDATDGDSGGGSAACRIVGDGCSGRSPDCCPIFGRPVVGTGSEQCVDNADPTVIGCAAVACPGGNAEAGCYEVTDSEGHVTVYITGSTWDAELLSTSVAACAEGEFLAVPQCE